MCEPPSILLHWRTHLHPTSTPRLLLLSLSHTGCLRVCMDLIGTELGPMCAGVSTRRPRPLKWLAIFSLGCILGQTEAKVVSGHVRLANSTVGNWAYVSKFSYAQGTGKFTVNVKTIEGEISNRARFLLYLDEDWENAVAARTCEEKMKLAKWQSPSLKSSTPIKHSVSQSIRPHFWYFVVADCRPSQADTKLWYSLEMRNSDGSHLSYEEKAPSRLIPILALAFFVALLPLALLVLSQPGRMGHASIQHLVTALGLFWASLVLHSLHYAVYGRDGKGMPGADVVAEVANWVAQLIVALELLSIAWAWTIDTTLSPSRKERTGKRLRTMMTVVLFALHVALVLLGRRYDDSHDKYHQSETMWAAGLIVMRLVMGGLFAAGVWNLMEREDNLLQKNFLWKLGGLGGAFFISIPLVVTLASTCCACYLRHQVVIVGSLVVQVASLVALSVLLLTRNEFTELASLHMTSLPFKFD